MLWSLGIGNPASSQGNQYLSYWGSLRADMNAERSELEGSSVSLLYYKGTETAGISTSQMVNQYWALEPAFNLRFSGFDIMGAYHMGEEDNYKLTATEFATKEKRKGITAVVAYMPNSWFQPGIQYDKVWYDQKIGSNKTQLHLRAGFNVKENFLVILSGTLDIHPKESASQSNVYQVMIRTMI